MEDKYKVIYFKKENGKIPVYEYIIKLALKDKSKIFDYLEHLSVYSDFRKEPFTRHLVGKLKELKVDFSSNRHRIIYFFSIGKTIILLNAFTKKSQKTPQKEINKAKNYMQEFLAS